jgi:hypothetical protein
LKKKDYNYSITDSTPLSVIQQQSLILCSLKENIVRKSATLGSQESLSSRLKSKYLPMVLFMMIMTLTLGRDKKRKRKSRTSNLSLV